MERRHTSLALTVVVLAACGGDASPAPEVEVERVDSAGVEIVTSAAPAWGPSSPWALSPEPVLTIGSVDGDPAYVLDRVGPVLRMPDGRIVVANGGSLQLRVYGPDGIHLYDIGGPGSGPGEFQALSRVMRIAGDSIMTYDFRLSRISVFDDTGALGRTLRLDPEGEASQAFARRPFDDGTLVVEGVMQGEAIRTGLFDGGKRTFARHAADGTHMNPLGEAPTGRRWGFSIDGSRAYASAPFAMGTVPAVGDGVRLHFGPGESPEIVSVDPTGRVVRITRWGATPIAVTAEVRETYASQRRALAEARYRSHTEAMLDGLVFPDRMPAFRSLLPDSEGYLWVERFRPFWEEGQQWWVFDPSGAWLGEPPVPSNLEIREIGSDYLLGVRRDELGVQSVAMYELRRDG